jgi:hypothetical protein
MTPPRWPIGCGLLVCSTSGLSSTTRPATPPAGTRREGERLRAVLPAPWRGAGPITRRRRREGAGGRTGAALRRTSARLVRRTCHLLLIQQEVAGRPPRQSDGMRRSGPAPGPLPRGARAGQAVEPAVEAPLPGRGWSTSGNVQLPEPPMSRKVRKIAGQRLVMRLCQRKGGPSPQGRPAGRGARPPSPAEGRPAETGQNPGCRLVCRYSRYTAGQRASAV